MDASADPAVDPLFGAWTAGPDPADEVSPIFSELAAKPEPSAPDVEVVPPEAGDDEVGPDAAADPHEPDMPASAAPEPAAPRAGIPETTALVAPAAMFASAEAAEPPTAEPVVRAPGPDPDATQVVAGPAATVPEPPSEPQPDPSPAPPTEPGPAPAPEPRPPAEPEPQPPPEPGPRRIDPDPTVRVAPLPAAIPPVGTTAREPAAWLSAERTVALPIVTNEAKTEVLRIPPPTGPPTGPQRRPPGAGGPTPPGRTPWSPRKSLASVIAAVLGLFAVLYIVDVITSSGEVPRGSTVAGVDIGGLSHSAAEEKLREEIGPRLGRPVALRAGDVDLTLDPAAAGLQLDWAGTVDAAGEQSLNPLVRLRNLFTHKDIDTVTIADREGVAQILEALRPHIDRAAAEGTIRFEGTTPVAVPPVTGQQLDVEGAVDAVLDHWADEGPVEVPVATTPVRTTAEGVASALETFARPAVSAPLTVTGEGVQGVLSPADIAGALRFTPAQDGGLTGALDPVAVQTVLGPAMAPSERPGRDATIVLQNNVPVVQSSADGRAVNWSTTLQPAPEVLTTTGSRSLPALYDLSPAKLTTEQANALGVKELISEFSTDGFAGDSGRNIKRVAEQVNGAIVKPGETFSLNGHTGPRNAAAGYVAAGVIENGRPERAIGGGISQFATTLYNASYFAGLVDVEHREHSYYISRYPAAREATVFEGAIDLRFKNDGPTGVLITTTWTPGDITVQMWGTKRYEVESITGDRFDFTGPPVRTVPAGQPCSPTNGSSGFSVTDTRVLREVGTGKEISRTPRTVRYTGQQRTVCPAPPVDQNATGAPPTFPPAPG